MQDRCRTSWATSAWHQLSVGETIPVCNCAKLRVCARVEHVLSVVSRLWEPGMAPYRVLAKNATWAFTTLVPPQILLGANSVAGICGFETAHNNCGWPSLPVSRALKEPMVTDMPTMAKGRTSLGVNDAIGSIQP